MPNLKSAKKRQRQTERRTARNMGQRSRMKTLIKTVMNADDADTALAAYRDASAVLDRMATRHIIHPNKARRKKSQLARRVKELGGTP